MSEGQKVSKWRPNTFFSPGGLDGIGLWLWDGGEERASSYWRAVSSDATLPDHFIFPVTLYFPPALITYDTR